MADARRLPSEGDRSGNAYIEPLLKPERGQVNKSVQQQRLRWHGVICNAVTSTFRLLVTPPAGPRTSALGNQTDRLDLPWMRIWKLERVSGSAVVSILTKTGETHRLVSLEDGDKDQARLMLKRLQEKVREARSCSQIGAESPFGSRLGRLPPSDCQVADRPTSKATARGLVTDDYGRMGLSNASNGFRAYVFEQGKPGPELMTYPNVIFVPSSFNRNQLQKSADFRGNAGSGRLPAVCWRHHGTGVVIARSGQPRPGLANSRCEEDEILLKMIADKGRAPFNEAEGLTVFDARPQLNAVANRA